MYRSATPVGLAPVDLISVLGVLRRRWVPILVCIVAALAGSFFLTSSAPKTYQATARLFVNIPAARGVQEALQGVQLSSQLIESYAEIATSRSAAQRISDRLEGQFSPGEVRSKIDASPDQDTLLLDVTATDTDPISAKDLANATANVLTELVAELESGNEGTVTARVIDPALTPSSPISPRPRNDLTIGLLLGVFAGIAVALLLEAADRSVTAPAQASEATGRPVLGNVPRHRHLSSEPLVALEGAGSPGAESYRSLRTAIRFLDAGSPVRTLLVTSATAGEGKTTTAANLAVAFAQSGERVVFVDADLRRPRGAALFGLENERGLTEVLGGSLRLDDALVNVRERLFVLPPGTLPANPSELLGSQSMADVLDALSRDADIVIIDSAPSLAVTDAVVLSALVDGTLLVVQWGKTSVDAVSDARAAHTNVNAEIVGVVLNGLRTGRRSYGTPYTTPNRRELRKTA